MLYQLPTGKAIEMDIAQFLDMTDEELKYLIAYNYGESVENPWHGSVLTKHGIQEIDENFEMPLDLINTPESDKFSFLNDSDVDDDEE